MIASRVPWSFTNETHPDSAIYFVLNFGVHGLAISDTMMTVMPKRCVFFLAFGIGLAWGCTSVTDEKVSPDPSCIEWKSSAEACNGSVSYCSRRYNELSFPTSHNAMSNEKDGWIGPNQRHPIKKQLFDGIRALMIDTHYDDTDGTHVPSLCHGSCQYGSIPLLAVLQTIEHFLRCNEEQVLTLIIEAYVSPEDTKSVFETAGLISYMYKHNRGGTWPTLQELIDKNQRLLVLSDDGGVDDWYMNIWDHAFETPFSAGKPDDLVCTKNRGELSNSLFILNHFLTTLVGFESLAEQVNHNPFFIERARLCQNQFNHIPNFPTVDFYNIGDLFKVSESLNK